MKTIARGFAHTNFFTDTTTENRPHTSILEDYLRSVVERYRPLTQVKVWFDRSESRRELARLDDRLLADVGVSRAEAVREAKKPFWQP